MALRQVCAYGWADCALHSSKECFPPSAVQGWIQTHCLAFRTVCVWAPTCHYSTFHLQAYSCTYFSILFVYLFFCRFIHSLNHSPSHSHIHSLNHIPYLEIAHGLLYSVCPNLQSLCSSSHLLHLTFRCSQALLKHPPSSSLRAQQTQEEFTESNRRFILCDCLWAPPWGVSRVCHSFNFQIWARGTYAFGTDNGYQTEKWRATPHVDS